MKDEFALAEGKMDEVLGDGYSVSDAGPTAFTSDPTDPLYGYSYQVVVHNVQPPDLDTSVDPTDTGYKNVEVSIINSKIGTYSINSLVTYY